MRFAVHIVLALICGGCFSSDPASDPGWPGWDRWSVSPDGTRKAATSTWTGRLGWQSVFDEEGTERRVAVLLDVSGLNPNDVMSPGGKILERRPMPEVFYLTDHNHRMLTAVDVPEGPVRVKGTVYTGMRGGVFQRDTTILHAHPTKPATLPSANGRSEAVSERIRLQSQIWPLIYVDKIEGEKETGQE